MAARVTCAPVDCVCLPKKRISAMRPPSIMHIVSIICSRVYSFRSFGTYCAYPSAAIPRGTIDTLSSGCEMWGEMWGQMWGEMRGEMWGQSDTLSSGLACLRNHPVTACPASWCATRVRSSSDSTLLFRSRPPITRSAAA